MKKRIYGNSTRPRLAVFRSNQHILAQIIDDKAGKTLVAVTDFKMGRAAKKIVAFEVGKKIAEKALKLKIKKVVFDRGGFLYIGRVAELARGAREGGLEF